MKTLVQKFGGTSVGSIENLERVISIIKDLKSESEPLFVVCSAFGGVTDQLIGAATIACTADQSYEQDIIAIKDRHIEVVEHFIPENVDVRIHIEESFDKISSLLKGVFLLGQLPDKLLM